MRRVAVLVAVVLLAACGSDGESGSSDDGGEPPKETTTSEPEDERDLEADQDIADGAVLTIDDMPDGYAEKPQDEDDEDDATFDRSLSECLGITVAELNDEAEPQAESTFANDARQEANSEVIVYATTEEAAEELDVFHDPANQQCLVDAYNELVAANDEVDFGEVTAEELDVEGPGDDAVGLEFTIPFVDEGEEQALILDAVLVRQGRAVISMGFTAFNAAFDAQLGSELVTTVIERVPADA